MNMLLGELTQSQRKILLRLVELERSQPSEAQGEQFFARSIFGKPFHIVFHGNEIPTSEAELKALHRLGYITLEHKDYIQGVHDHYVGTLMAKAHKLYNEINNSVERSPDLVEDNQESRYDPDSLSPHDEHILFKLIEFDRSLSREEQSWRFNVNIIEPEGGGAPTSAIRGDNSFQEIQMNASTSTFRTLRSAHFIQGGKVLGSSHHFGSHSEYGLDTVELTPTAFRYYDEKHEFPIALADERKEFVDSVVSTEYPEVVSRLKKAYDDVWVTQPNDDWSGVAHECQSALSAFADKIYKSEIAVKTGDDQPRHGQYEKKILLAIKNVTGGESEIGKLLIALNDYQDSLRHDRGKPDQPPTTQSEARRIVLFTYLLIAEIYELLNPVKTPEK